MTYETNAGKELTEVASGLAAEAPKSTTLPRFADAAAPPVTDPLPAVGEGDRLDMRLTAQCHGYGLVK
jgi:hypothetical protein